MLVPSANSRLTYTFASEPVRAEGEFDANLCIIRSGEAAVLWDSRNAAKHKKFSRNSSVDAEPAAPDGGGAAKATKDTAPRKAAEAVAKPSADAHGSTPAGDPAAAAAKTASGAA